MVDLGRFHTEESRARSINAPRKADGKRWRGKLNIPPKGHPLVRGMFSLMNSTEMQMEEVAQESGVSRSTLWSWGHTRMPGIDKLDACLNVLGYKLAIVRTAEPAAKVRRPELIAAYLRQMYPQYVTAEDVAANNGIAISSVPVYISQMRKAGYEIESTKGWGAGYRLAPPSCLLETHVDPVAEQEEEGGLRQRRQ